MRQQLEYWDDMRCSKKYEYGSECYFDSFGDDTMALSYNCMWKLLVDKKDEQGGSLESRDIAPNTMTKLRRDEAVSLAILERICDVLNCDFADIMDIKLTDTENSSR